MPAFAKTAKVGGSFEGQKPKDYYRSPVELGWTKNIKFDHQFLGREALEEEVAHPKRTRSGRPLVSVPEDVIDVPPLFSKKDEALPFMDIPDQRKLNVSQRF